MCKFKRIICRTHQFYCNFVCNTTPALSLYSQSFVYYSRLFVSRVYRLNVFINSIESCQSYVFVATKWATYLFPHMYGTQPFHFPLFLGKKNSMHQLVLILCLMLFKWMKCRSIDKRASAKRNSETIANLVAETKRDK